MRQRRRRGRIKEAESKRRAKKRDRRIESEERRQENQTVPSLVWSAGHATLFPIDSCTYISHEFSHSLQTTISLNLGKH
jgi:hypothetical protein